ncbi:MAG: Rne/Rng family ribonuclease [Deltaproteobacteria bacterium]|nr:Rne/Rng family ribonuclease [Deltaproteobacteria bacterium]
MANQLIINTTAHETRVALLEGGLLTELYIERARDQGIVGNIYKGRVTRVLPGMQASFVDIGMEKAAFLYVTDVYDDFEEFELSGGERPEPAPVDEEEVEAEGRPRGGRSPIQDLLREGQEILVQVAKEPLGSKGARITSHITLPGRHLVFLPTFEHVGVSRRIKNDRERRRLRDVVMRLRPPGSGCIIRTASEGRDEEELRADMEFLVRLWNSVQRKKDAAPAPSLVYQELDISLRAIRDLVSEEMDKVVVDSKEEYERILEFMDGFLPRLKGIVQHYDREEPIFDAYGVEVEINRALNRRVWLKSGGYIVIDVREALTSIDVNTGRYVGRRNLEDTILKTNLEAVKEIAYQLRLRNLGGIIIIDFIDMEREGNREKVYNTLVEALKTDKARTNILRISELGLVEMTRQRTRENLSQVLCEPCFYCEGKGLLRSRATICYDIFREIRREAPDLKGKKIMVTCHPDIADLLYDEERAGVEALEKRLEKGIVVRAKSTFHLEQYEVANAN